MNQPITLGEVGGGEGDKKWGSKTIIVFFCVCFYQVFDIQNYVFDNLILNRRDIFVNTRYLKRCVHFFQVEETRQKSSLTNITSSSAQFFSLAIICNLCLTTGYLV